MFDLKDKVTVVMYKAATTTLYFTWDCFGKSYYEKCKQKFCSVKGLVTNVTLNCMSHIMF